MVSGGWIRLKFEIGLLFGTAMSGNRSKIVKAEEICIAD